MPIYEYRCTVCGKVFDKWQSFQDPPPPCPEDHPHTEDGEPETVRLLSRGAFILKGGGWYKDGY